MMAAALKSDYCVYSGPTSYLFCTLYFLLKKGASLVDFGEGLYTGRAEEEADLNS